VISLINIEGFGVLRFFLVQVDLVLLLLELVVLPLNLVIQQHHVGSSGTVFRQHVGFRRRYRNGTAGFGLGFRRSTARLIIVAHIHIRLIVHIIRLIVHIIRLVVGHHSIIRVDRLPEFFLALEGDFLALRRQPLLVLLFILIP
jgi:hypothetical protein